MANQYYNNDTNTIIDGTLAAASDVENKLDDVAAGFDLIEVVQGQGLLLTAADHTTRSITELAATRANTNIGFDSTGDLVTRPVSGSYDGDWTTATYYVIGTTVKDAAGALGYGVDSILVCLTTHVSSATLIGDTANWDVLINTGDLDQAVLDAQTAAIESQASADESDTSAGESLVSAAAALASESASQLSVWEAEAEKMTADSYATEAEDVFVKTWASDGDGTFTPTNTTEYSALHWATKSATIDPSLKVDKAGDTMTGQLVGITPVADGDLTRKDYVDTKVDSAGYTGKNILINGDKSVSQRGDYTAPQALIVNGYYIDRYRIDRANNSCLIEHKVYQSVFGCRTLKLTAKASATYLVSTQKVENYEALKGRVVTYTADVRSDFVCKLTLDDGVNTINSAPHTGNGEIQRLSITTTLSTSSTKLWAYVQDDTNPLDDQYFEVGNEQLELGGKFTGFEIVSPLLQLLNCGEPDDTNSYGYKNWDTLRTLGRLDSGTSTTPDVSTLKSGGVILVDSGVTVTDFINGYAGQVIRVSAGGGTATITRNNAYLPGSTNYTLTANNFITLVSRSGLWYTTSTESTNG